MASETPKEELFFAVATPVSKPLFLDTYKDIAYASQLLLAPLGTTLRVSVTQVLGNSQAAEEYTRIFRSWEEVVSRAVYARKGISDDKVAASMHQFLEVDKDHEVLTAIGAEADSILKILTSPDAVEMPRGVALDSLLASVHATARNTHLSSLSAPDIWLYGDVVTGGAEGDTFSLNVCTPRMTAVLMTRVLNAVSSVCTAEEIPAYWRSKYGRDQAMDQVAGVCVGKRPFAPADVLLLPQQEVAAAAAAAAAAIGANAKEVLGCSGSSLPSAEGHAYTSGGLSIATIDALLTALTVQVPSDPPTCARLSVLQYFTLLDLHAQHDEVTSVLTERFGVKACKGGLPLLDLIRVGVTSNSSPELWDEDEDANGGGAPGTGTGAARKRKQGPGLQLSAGTDPVFAAVVQLQHSAMTAASEVPETDKDTPFVEAHLEVLLKLLEAQTEAKEQSNSGHEGSGKLRAAATIRRAMRDAERTLRAAFGQGPALGEDDDGEDGDEDGEGEMQELLYEEDPRKSNSNPSFLGAASAPLVPTALFTSLLCDRAKYLLGAFEERQAGLDFRPATIADHPVQSPLLRRAVHACDTAIAADRFCSEAYVYRSSIGGLAGECELAYVAEAQQQIEQMRKFGMAEEEADVDEANSGKECRLLRAAAKDALAAFLLGGSTNLTHAGGAEEASRQASRVAAKTVYMQKNADLEDFTVVGEESRLLLPKAWLIQAYMAGYLPPSLAFSAPSLPVKMQGMSAEESLAELSSLKWITSNSVPANTARSEAAAAYSAGSIVDIDDQDTNTEEALYLTELPLPPDALMERVAAENPDEDKVACSRASDRQAYRLLRQLCDLLRAAIAETAPAPALAPAVADDSSASKSAELGQESFLASAYNAKKAARELERQRAHAAYRGPQIAMSTVHNEEAFLKLCSPPKEENTLAMQGLCEPVSETEKETEANLLQRNMEPEEELEGEGLGLGLKPAVLAAISLDVSAGLEAPASAAFSGFVALLHSADVECLTGVHFDTRSGRVVALKKVKSNKDEEEDEEEWEDEDSEDKSESSDASHKSDEEEEEEEDAASIIQVSRPLRARLFNLCAVAAYLSGDASGAVQCLRASLHAQPLPSSSLRAPVVGPEALAAVDAAIKLGALLVDMDEREEAGEVLDSALAGAEEVRTNDGGLRAAASATAMLHAAELKIHELDYDAAVNYLGRAERVVSRALRNAVEYAPADVSEADKSVLTEYLRLLTANIASLQGVALYRYAPQEPDQALRTLRYACQENPTQLYLLLCYGEVLSQAGDLVGSLSCFEAAHRLNPRNPLPFVNAARTYQQMSQPSTSERHLQCAVAIDPTFALTHIDVAQGLLHRGAVQEALKTLDYALRLSRHVSDICDVLTARTVATLQKELQDEGLYAPPPQA